MKTFVGGALVAALTIVGLWLKLRKRQLNSALAALHGKVVVITGASSGLGEACAHEFCLRGCKLVLCARRMSELQRVKSCLEQLDREKPSKWARYEVKCVTFDLSDLPSIAKAMHSVRSCHGPIDIIINNAGVSQRGSVINTSLDVQMSVMNINYFSHIAVTKEVLPEMISRKTGHIVAISSIQGKLALPFRPAYGASKHAVQSFFDSVRAEVAQDGIHVTVVSPGYIHTSLSENALTEDGTMYGKADKSLLTGMSSEYVAKQILYSVARREKEVLVAPLFYRLATYPRNLLPNVFAYVMRRRAEKESHIYHKQC